jgi:hypothetical protein
LALKKANNQRLSAEQCARGADVGGHYCYPSLCNLNGGELTSFFRLLWSKSVLLRNRLSIGFHAHHEIQFIV